MEVTRRDFLRFGLGGAAAMLTAAAAPLLQSTEAYAIAGVDDAVLGGVLLVMLTLAGYTVSDAMLSTNLSAMGYDFSRFVQDANNQSAAVTRAIADANNLGVQVNRQNAEDAAAAIAAGTGAAGQWFADVADSGRIALDGWLSGIGANQAAIWGLVSEYMENMLSTYPTAVSGSTFTSDSSYSVDSTGLRFRVAPIADLLATIGGASLGFTPSWVVMGSEMWNGHRGYFMGTGATPVFEAGPSLRSFDSFKEIVYTPTNANPVAVYDRSGWQHWQTGTWGQPVVSDNVITGGLLPGVDRAADAPETYGAGYDKTILGSDLVIDPATGDVVSAGTIALPVEYPYVQLPYVDGLYQQGAGVVAGLHDLPLSGQTSAVVGTGEGVVSMPISQAISTDTSLAEQAEPVVPPGTPDVGPWVPAYDLPFYEVWPFNMVYSFVSALSELGGA